MKITVWGINYSPELTGIAPYNTALCQYLREQGHEVRMVTTFSYYPAWRKLPNEARLLTRTEELDGVTVHRCWHYVPERVTSLKRILHEGSFVVVSWCRLLLLPRADVMVVVSPPLLLGAAAWVLGRLKGSPFVFHVQDLQPDAAAGLGMLKNGWLIRALYALERLAYTKAARVSGICAGMLEAFSRKGFAAKRVSFPNGVELPAPHEIPARGRFRAAHGYGPDDFLVVYSGNLGVKQGLEILIEGARLVSHPRVRLLICGEGSQRDALADLLARYPGTPVRMLPLQAELRYREMLVDADLCVITQQRGSGAFFFPSKLLTTLALARPVLTVADEESDLVQALRENGFGVNVPPGHPELLAQVLDNLAAHPEQLHAFGRAGHQFVVQFAMDRVHGEFVKVLRQVRDER